MRSRLCALVLFLAGNIALADSYDPATNRLTIPTITVAGTTYSQVVVTPARLISLNLGAVAPVTSFDLTTGILTVPSVVIAGTTFSNVKVTLAGVVSIGSQTPATGSGTAATGLGKLMGGAIQGTSLTIAANAGMVTTMAGNSRSVRGTRDDIGVEATFNKPVDIAADGANLYVVDTGSNTVRKIHIATGAVTTLAGSGLVGSADGTGAGASFSSLSGITTDGTYLYLVDTNNHKIRKVVIATGVVTTLAGSGSSGSADGTGTAAKFNYPHSVTTDGTNLYIADSANNKIRKLVIATGVVTTLAGDGVQGSADGTGPGATFNYPYGITTDGKYLYVTDAHNNNIRKITLSTGTVTTLAGGRSAGSADGTGVGASFSSPYGVATDGTNLYIADSGNNKIRKVAIATGAVTTLAGSGSAGSADGTGAGASFSSAYGITTDGTNLFVADSGNGEIRRIGDKAVAPIAAMPTVTGVTPGAAAAGTRVTISGTNFDPIPANNMVSLNGALATVTAATPTSLTVTVPAGTTSGAVYVTTVAGTTVSGTPFNVSSATGTSSPGTSAPPACGAPRVMQNGACVIPTPQINRVTPGSAVVDRITTFTVTGTSLSDGLKFTLDGCYGVRELPGGTDTMRTFSCLVLSGGARVGHVKNELSDTTYFDFQVNGDPTLLPNSLHFSEPMRNGESIFMFPTPSVGAVASRGMITWTSGNLSPAFGVRTQTFGLASPGFVSLGFLYFFNDETKSEDISVFEIAYHEGGNDVMAFDSSQSRNPAKYDFGFPADLRSYDRCHLFGPTEYETALYQQTQASVRAIREGTVLTAAQKAELQRAVDDADNPPACADIGIVLDARQGLLVFEHARLAFYENGNFLAPPKKTIRVDGAFAFTPLTVTALQQVADAKAEKAAADAVAAKQAADAAASKAATDAAAAKAAADAAAAKSAADALAAKLAAEAQAAEAAAGVKLPDGVLFACNAPGYYTCQEYYVGSPNCGTNPVDQLANACFHSGTIGRCVSAGFFTTYFYQGYPADVAMQVCQYQPSGVWSAN